MTRWIKKYLGGEKDENCEIFGYKCECGTIQDDYEYNADTGHYECSICGSESPDLDMIPEGVLI